jgi:hypothetical protein
VPKAVFAVSSFRSPHRIASRSQCTSSRILICAASTLPRSAGHGRTLRFGLDYARRNASISRSTPYPSQTSLARRKRGKPSYKFPRSFRPPRLPHALRPQLTVVLGVAAGLGFCALGFPAFAPNPCQVIFDRFTHNSHRNASGLRCQYEVEALEAKLAAKS